MVAGLAGSAAAQLRIVTWNVTNYNTTSPGGRDSLFQTAVYGVVPSGPLAGQRMAPDVFVGQEFINAAAVDNFRNLLNSASGSPGDWASATFVDGTDTDSAFFYRTSKVQFLGLKIIAPGVTGNCNQPRNTMRYDLRPVGYSAVGTSIGIYSVHLKAQGSNAACPAGENAQGRRLLEAQRIRDNAEGINTNGAGTALPAGYMFMVMGDLNITNSADVEYQELVGSQVNNAGRLFDPINTPGNWNNNSAFRIVHTQDPFPSAGGMDDRFDQILVSAGAINGSGFEYIGNPAIPYSTTTWNDPNHSYRVWGNDGSSCCSSGLNVTTNGFVGNTIAQALSDTQDPTGHLPVLADFRVPAKVTSTTTIAFGQVTQGSLQSRSFSVSNAGNTALWNAAGIANLNYSMSASSGYTVPGGGFVDAPGGATNSHSVTMNTSALGVLNGTITITSDDPDQPTRIITITGEVVGANQPPVAHAGADQTVTDSDGNGSEPVTLDGTLSTDPDGTIADYHWTEGVSLLAQGPGATAGVTLAVGVHTIQLEVTDNLAAADTDTVVVTVNPMPCVADLDDGSGTGTPDGGVTIDDLLYYLSLFEAGSLAADVDDGSGTGTPDGGVTIDDLLYFLVRFEAGC